jgi:hypothetical protein
MTEVGSPARFNSAGKPFYYEEPSDARASEFGY